MLLDAELSQVAKTELENRIILISYFPPGLRGEKAGSVVVTKLAQLATRRVRAFVDLQFVGAANLETEMTDASWL